MRPEQSDILTINGGSSTIKFALFSTQPKLARGTYGKIDRIGSAGTHLTYDDPVTQLQTRIEIDDKTHPSPVNFLMDTLAAQGLLASVGAVGHRVVHGMRHSAPELVTSTLMQALASISPFDPDHMPGELALIEAFRQRYPDLLQVACFDTAFHSTMPRVARQIAIPRRYESEGVQRYGFHGLSYAYLMQELARIDAPMASSGLVILAHLGSGASMAAVRNGQSIDTSMGFTPASGLPMSTRAGDLDPGLISYLAQTSNISIQDFQQMINHESGLLGVSETSADFRDLLVLENTDIRAAEAINLFCYQAKKMIGSYAAALGGVDTLVFSGGVGENSPAIRARICDGLEFLGIKIADEKNAKNAALISSEFSRVTVRIIHTDEELMIATSVKSLLDSQSL